MINYFVQ